MRTLIVFAAAVCISLNAATITYSTLSSWQAGGPQSAGMVTFDGIAQGQYFSVSQSGFTFAGNGGTVIVYNPPVSFTDLGAGPSLLGPQGPASIDITLPTGVYGMGFLVGTSTGTPITVVINGNIAAPLTISATSVPPASAFWGLRSDIELATVRLYTSANMRVVIDSVVWGGRGSPPPPEVPEPGAYQLTAIALAAWILRRRVRILVPK